MRTLGSDFNKNATELKKIMYMRNLKLKIILALIVIAIVAYITMPIIKSLSWLDII
jgi:hypothetical protein